MGELGRPTTNLAVKATLFNRPVFFATLFSINGIMEILTKTSKIRFILSNHKSCKTVEKLVEILKALNISVGEFDIDVEAWYASNNWWDDDKFMTLMKNVGINVPENFTPRIQA